MKGNENREDNTKKAFNKMLVEINWKTRWPQIPSFRIHLTLMFALRALC